MDFLDFFRLREERSSIGMAVDRSSPLTTASFFRFLDFDIAEGSALALASFESTSVGSRFCGLSGSSVEPVVDVGPMAEEVGRSQVPVDSLLFLRFFFFTSAVAAGDPMTSEL